MKKSIKTLCKVHPLQLSAYTLETAISLLEVTHKTGKKAKQKRKLPEAFLARALTRTIFLDFVESILSVLIHSCVLFSKAKFGISYHTTSLLCTAEKHSRNLQITRWELKKCFVVWQKETLKSLKTNFKRLCSIGFVFSSRGCIQLVHIYDTTIYCEIDVICS